MGDGGVKQEMEGAHELKSAEAILERAEEWAEKVQQQRLAEGGNVESRDEEAGSRVRTLNVRSGLEVEG